VQKFAALTFLIWIQYKMSISERLGTAINLLTPNREALGLNPDCEPYKLTEGYMDKLQSLQSSATVYMPNSFIHSPP
jgi:hypothetical protein